MIKHAELNNCREIFYFIANGRKNLVLSPRREHCFRTILSQYRAGIPQRQTAPGVEIGELSFALTPQPTPSPIISRTLFLALSSLSLFLEWAIFRDYVRINFSFSELILRVTSQKEESAVFVCDLSMLLPRQEHTIRLTSI